MADLLNGILYSSKNQWTVNNTKNLINVTIVNVNQWTQVIDDSTQHNTIFITHENKYNYLYMKWD